MNGVKDYRVSFIYGTEVLARSNINKGFIPREGESIVIQQQSYEVDEIIHIYPDEDEFKWEIEVYLD